MPSLHDRFAKFPRLAILASIARVSRIALIACISLMALITLLALTLRPAADADAGPADRADPHGMLPLPIHLRFPDARPAMPTEPAPLPLRSAGEPEDENRLLTIDRETGQVTERTLAGVQDMLGKRYTEAGIGIDQLLEDPESVAKNFSAWSLVSDPAAGDFPRRVKVFARFRDISGTAVDIVCSGTLIDPKHVLTAAHCIWSHMIDAHVINNFAEVVEVAPGYLNENEPFGTAQSTQLHVWTLWTDDWDYDHDLGIVDLDRPVGALTGWWGYGYDTACDSWESAIWHHAGWPAETPFDGLLMYENSGSFDDCEQDGWDNRASWDGPSWGGTSGAGALKSTTGAVYGVFSTSDRATVSVDCKLTETKFGQVGQIIAEDTPAAFDLAVLDANGPAQVLAGERPAFLNFAVFNYSSASAGGTYAYSAFLSTDDFISLGDTYIGSGTFTHTFGAVSGTRVWADVPPLIPADTPAGPYFLGVIVDAADGDPGNNAGNGQEIAAIEVVCPPVWAPALSMPIDGQACVAPDMLFSWAVVAPQAFYQLQIGTACGDGPIVETPLVSYSCYGLSLGTTYAWRVRARAQCGDWGPWSLCRTFRTTPDPTAVSNAVAPQDGEHCQGGSRFVLDWTSLPDAVTYDLQISPEYCYQGTIIAGITDSALAMPGLLPNTTYYWRVRAHTICGQTTDWSSTPGFCWTFKTAPETLAAPVRIGPADGTTCGASTTVLIWSHVADWDHYEVQIGTSCGTGTVLTTTSNSCSPSGLQSGVPYYWRVRAFDECGLVSPWTTCWSFSLDLEPPVNPTTLTSSSHTAGVWSTTDNTVDVQWNWGWDNCAGSWPQYATLWDRSPTTAPTVITTSGELTLETSPPLPDGNDHWFHVRTVDYAGNYAPQTLHLGPFWIDLTPPTAPVLDYATLDPGQVIGLTRLDIDWLAAADSASGLAGYSLVLSSSATPPAALDNTVETTGLWSSLAVFKTVPNYFHLRAVDNAGLGSGVLTHGPVTINPDFFGIYFTAPGRGEVLEEGDVFRIAWELYDNGAGAMWSGRLEYSLDAGATYASIANLTPAQVRQEWFDWTVPLATAEEAVLRLRVTDVTGGSVWVRSVRFGLQQLSPVGPPALAAGVALEPAWPNPFNPRTTIAFSLPDRMRVRLAIYDMTGKSVRTLIDGADLPQGRHEAAWDGANAEGRTVAAGVYLYRLEAGEHRQARTMVLVK